MRAKDIKPLGLAHVGCVVMSAKAGGVLKSPSPNTSGVWTWSCPHLLYVVLEIRFANGLIYWPFTFS